MSAATSTSSVALADNDKYDILERIGSGSFGIIRKVRRKSDGLILCRKEIAYLKMSTKEREQLMSEFNILSSLRHPNIVAYYHREHLKSTQELYLYMEYCGGGDLGAIIKSLKNSNKYAEEEFVWRILSQLVTALYRCHYGVNPPEAGSNVLGPSSNKATGGLKSKQGQVMILHRDLKPDNIFLGEDQSVKLGDFGLSKLMRSQDFASTYVGTPFYMSPEICAGEKYTLYSDIWAVGCIMYELCAKEPPFNARTHIQLIHKIREGRFPSLPSIYSTELKSLIASCLKVNPQLRPDTAALLNNPVIRLMRKEMEVVGVGKTLQTKEEIAVKKLKEIEAAYALLEKERQTMRVELEDSIRREWELKARAEIERQVQMEFEKLRQRFETEVQERVATELQKHLTESSMSFVTTAETKNVSGSSGNSSASASGSGSGSGSEEDEFPSTTELSALTLNSPPVNKRIDPIKEISRTPFSSKTKTVVSSPYDVDMAEPSPMKIDDMSLSPMRKSNFIARRDTVVFSDDEDDETEDVPSPSRPKFTRAPQRPLMRAKTTSSMARLAMAQTNMAKQDGRQNSLTNATSHSDLQSNHQEAQDHSPVRRNKTTPANPGVGSPLRRVPNNRPPANRAYTAGGEGMLKAALQRNMGGRTLVELSQARAGGRPIEEVKPKNNQNMPPPARSAHPTGTAGSVTAFPPVVWDPETVEDMPSPFLIKSKIIRNLR